MQPYWLGFLFVSFSIGVACLGVVINLAVRRRDAVSRAFFAFYAALSIMVTASLLSAFADTAPGVVPASLRPVFQYFESIIGLYGVMLTLPLLVHRVFRIDDSRRERILVAVVFATFGLQHVTEFALGSTPWDERGDWFEDGVLLVIVAYAFWVVWSRLGSVEAERPLATRMFALLVLGTPGFFCDLFLSEGWGLRLYPLWYCATSVVVTWTLLRAESEPNAPRSGVEEGWGLSAREVEVANRVACGLSNRDISAVLHISPNTVKTHLRTIFGKAGVRSRFELISRMSGIPRENHPKG